MTEHSIPVVFDLVATSRDAAARELVRWLKALDLTGDVVRGGASHRIVESWWLPEADLKGIDGNDNPDRILVDPAIIREAIHVLAFFMDHGGGLRTCDANACPSCDASALEERMNKALGS